VAFFEDLTPYTYFHPEEEGEVVNVGWLDPIHPFPVGETSEAFRDKLFRLCQIPLQQTRGGYPCYYCKDRDRIPVSSCEMRVAGNGKVYAAPQLVHHYVVAHGYKPPDEFIAAVLAWVE
jgi:hypothetical protein